VDGLVTQTRLAGVAKPARAGPASSLLSTTGQVSLRFDLPAVAWLRNVTNGANALY
jgi:hypothetical protein